MPSHDLVLKQGTASKKVTVAHQSTDGPIDYDLSTIRIEHLRKMQ
jgi:hypothetical protein